MLVHFPTPYPDELLYSTCARYGDIMQYRLKGHLCEDLFGLSVNTYTADLPKYLNRLIASFQPGHKYTTDYLINHHTLLPFYAPFLSLTHFQSLFETMVKGKDHRNQMSNQIRRHSNNSTSSPRLKFCQSCVSEDRATHGECFWHRVHQVPDVFVCPTHGDFLDESNVFVTNSRANNLFISAETAINWTSTQLDELKPYHNVLMKIAQDAQWLLERHKMICKLPEIRSRYIYLLTEARLASYSGFVQSKRLLETFQNYYTPDFLRAIGFELDCTNPHNWLVRLVNRYGQKKFQNPLGHLLLINFLGYSIQEFFELPHEPKYFGEAPWPCLNPVCKFYKIECIASYDLSKCKSNLPVGIFRCGYCDFTYGREGPDKTEQDKLRYNYVRAYGHVWEEELKRLLKDNLFTISQIATKLDVAKDTVQVQARRLGVEISHNTAFQNEAEFQAKLNRYRNKLLGLAQKHPELSFRRLEKKAKGIHTWLYRNDPEWLASFRASWPTKKKEKKGQTTYRKEFLEARQKYPNAGRTELRLNIVTTQYNWLYRYDREWLLKNLPAKKPTYRSPKKDWGKLDKQVEKKVREFAAQMRNPNERPQRITKTAIGNGIGMSYLFKNSLHKLPLTSKAINEEVESYVEVTLRRIEWVANNFVRKGEIPSRSELMLKASAYQYRTVPKLKIAIDNAMEFIYKIVQNSN